MERQSSPESGIPYRGAGLTGVRDPLWRGRSDPSQGSPMEGQSSPEPEVLRMCRPLRELQVPADPQGLAGAPSVGGVPSRVPGPAGCLCGAGLQPGQLPLEAFKLVPPEKQTHGCFKSIPTKVQGQENVVLFIFRSLCWYTATDGTQAT